MILDYFDSENTKIVVSYLPAWEMFFSMHVLASPEHHISRKKWAKDKEEQFPVLTEEIRKLGGLTDFWLFIIDSEKWSAIRQMEIPELLSFFRKKHIYEWNEWVKCPAEGMSVQQRNEILSVMERYYEQIFRKEELVLRPYLLRILREEREKCLREGIWSWCKKVHPRLTVGQDEVVYLKNREFRYKKENIRTVYVTASTFLHPHLWLYQDETGLEMVKGVITEPINCGIPEDFMRMLRALGEPTRLQIVKHLMQGTCTTKALSKEMGISGAAVSRHLKLMLQAGLVRKRKNGYYTEYEFITERIDFIPYTFYETMLQ